MTLTDPITKKFVLAGQFFVKNFGTESNYRGIMQQVADCKRKHNTDQ
jgi:hypothetical protein